MTRNKAQESEMNYIPVTTETTVRMGILEVEGLHIFYREAGKPGNPRLALLHGFPASSHQYRNLVPALADKFPVVAIDYPGFGNSDMPDPAELSLHLRQDLRSGGGLLGEEGIHPIRSLRAGLRRAGVARNILRFYDEQVAAR